MKSASLSLATTCAFIIGGIAGFLIWLVTDGAAYSD